MTHEVTHYYFGAKSMGMLMKMAKYSVKMGLSYFAVGT